MASGRLRVMVATPSAFSSKTNVINRRLLLHISRQFARPLWRLSRTVFPDRTAATVRTSVPDHPQQSVLALYWQPLAQSGAHILMASYHCRLLRRIFPVCYLLW